MIAKSVEEVGAAFADAVEEVLAGGPMVITKDGEPVAALVTFGDYQWLEEAEDEWLSRLVAEAEAEPGYDPNDAIPAEEVFRRLRERDEAKRADAAE